MSIPRPVKNAFDAVKSQQQHVYLKHLNGNYYVYKQTYAWSKDQDKSRTISEYIGKITPDGVFIKKTTSYKNELEKARALIESRGGEILWNRREAEQVPAPGAHELQPRLRETDLKILMALSMNSRMPISRLSQHAGLSAKTAYLRVKLLEKRLGIKYLLELDLERLGYTPYILLVKFKDIIPSREEIKSTFANDPKVQLVMLTKGDFDLVIYLVDVNYISAIDNFRALILKTDMAEYKATWNLIPYAKTYAFMPVRDEFIDSVLGDKTKKGARGGPGSREELFQRELIVLRELNSNSVQSFSYIDKKYRLNEGTARYAYNQLKVREIITRPTISMTNLPIKYIGLIHIMNVDEKNVEDNRYKSLFDIMEYKEITNKYCLSGNIGMPDGAMRFIPIFRDGELDEATERIEKDLQGSTVTNLVATDMVVGSFCYRRFDNDYSRQHNLLVEFGKAGPNLSTKYE